MPNRKAGPRFGIAADHKTIANHEAAHAVMALMSGRWVTERGIVVDMNWPITPGSVVGTCHTVGIAPERAKSMYDRGGAHWQIYTLNVLLDVMVSLAGPLAEAKHIGHRVGVALLPDEDDPTTDISVVWNLLRSYLDVQGKCTETALASCVLVFQEHVKKVIRRPRVWSAIQDVASAVLAGNGFLSGEDADTIVGGIINVTDVAYVTRFVA